MSAIDIDWDRDGRQAGYLHLPNSTNVSAWQDLRVPVYLFRNGEGPCTLLLGGNHGDEYEGITGLSALAHSLDPAGITGSVIIVPALNLPAVLAGARLSPVDGRNLNREFPGDPRGSLTQRLAALVVSELVPRADAVYDIHSGGRSLLFAPCTLVHEQADGELTRRCLAAADSFGAPFTVVIREPHAGQMLDDVVERSGRLMVSSELGGSAAISPGTMGLTRDGLLRLLAHLGHLSAADLPPAAPGRRLVVPGPQAYLHADDLGTYEPMVEIGRSVAEGTVIGRLHFVDRADRAPQPLRAPLGGILLCVHGQGLVRRDDVIAVIAVPYGE
ncbi:N-alpha-acetyl diaminobutyric acid deacetylase DoeB [Aureimonas sp. SA4125]|uniref:succinylglutamate desuccinylase/aspartoacylase domain-containing protein n=1 Tax=Aureimonas sp. SA4125 TaxID=2826993 RepID=UPI001CC4E597|nr:succinylglutamate desuccinylase/aspartoacylase family protein [Aureimonas sp. SA4125]BDA86998.1 N-alpha-acetyl diaminobutyric acid deacetylase DoeB [Aureimonas sp. SA4125]